MPGRTGFSLRRTSSYQRGRTRCALSELRDILHEIEGFLARAHAASSRPQHSGRLLGTLLVLRGFVTQSELEYALHVQETTGQRIGEIVVKLGFVDEDVVVELIAEQLRITVFDANVNTVDVEVARRMSEADARRLCAVPIRRTRGCVFVAVAEPTRHDLVAELVKRLHLPVVLCAATHATIADLIRSAYSNTSSTGPHA